MKYQHPPKIADYIRRRNLSLIVKYPYLKDEFLRVYEGYLYPVYKDKNG